jgi:sugar lactone lactonase YvrE
MTTASPPPSTGPLEPTSALRAELGEGPVWDEHRQRLLWLDLTGGVLHFYDPLTGTSDKRHLGRPLGSVVPDGQGGLVIAAEGGLFQLTEGGLRQILSLEEPQTGAIPNDSCCDPTGNLWLGTATMDEVPGAGSLYRVTPSLTVTKVLSGLTVPNGIDWSPDGRTMYFTDSAWHRIDAFRFDPFSGSLGERRTFASFLPGDGAPDGLTVDSDGCVWVALWGGWSVRRYSPGGTHDFTIDLPVQHVSSCGFGGAGLHDLYITTAFFGLDPGTKRSQPAAGGLFRCHVPVPGRPVRPFPANLPFPVPTPGQFRP